MIDTRPAQPVLRTNQAVAPAAPFSRPRLVATRGDAIRTADRAASEKWSADLWPDRRPNLLSRVARAARLVVIEVRQSGDVPLPHLYRGRDFGRQRDAA